MQRFIDGRGSGIRNEPERNVGEALTAMPSFDPGAFGTKFGGVTTATVRPGYVLFSQGDAADALFYIKAGQVRITVLSHRGKVGILGILESGDFCGEGSLLGKRLRRATATCIAESVVVRLESANVVRAIREDPAVAEFFLVLALTGAVRLRERFIGQLFDSGERRLARSLLALAHCGRGFPDSRQYLIRNVDQGELAQMVGITRSRVNGYMIKFRDAGWIDYSNRVIRVRPSLFAAVFDKEPSDRKAPQRHDGLPHY